jgi:signal transduction histidine kinase
MFIAGGLVGVSLAAMWMKARGRSPAAPTLPDPSGETVPADPIDPVLELLAEGVIVLNDLLRPVLSNAAARRLTGATEGALPPDEVMSIARRAFTTSRHVEETVDLWHPERTSVLVSAQPLADEAGVLVSLRDISSEQRALRLRRQFVSHASHELKSPVASIQALAEAISQAARDDAAAVEQFSQKMLVETARVGKLVADLLDLSRIEDPISFRREAVHVSEVARKVAAEVDASAAAKNLTFRAEVDDEVWTQGDDQQLSLLVRNLLDNAIRYTPESGSVVLQVCREGDQAIVRVIDDGIGIPLRDQARVFERFYRVDEARSRDQGGTGLGLAIVKHVADLYGGRVEVRSEFGEGSTFTAYLPALPAASEVGART